MNWLLAIVLSIAGLCIGASLLGPPLRRSEDRLQADLEQLERGDNSASS